MLQRISTAGNRYGWGVVLAAAPFVNAIAVATVGLGTFLLFLFFSMFGVYPAPPAETYNPFSWILYFLLFACYGWWIWSMVMFYFLVPLALAWSLADLLLARTTGDRDRAVGASAGLVMTLLPLLLYLRATGNPAADFSGLIAQLQAIAA